MPVLEGYGPIRDATGERYEEEFRTRAKAVGEVARRQAGGMRFHDLRHSYATWLVDDGVPVNMVQRVLGHEKSTTLDLYTRRTDNRARILDARTDEDDDEGSAADALARAW
jgi:integrase